MPTTPEMIDRYQILEKIEESNYAEIYKIQDPEKNIRILKIARDKSPNYNELIAREFQVLSQFQHPNIVPVYDYGVVEDGRAYFTSEYIKGKPINDVFKGLTDEFIAAKVQVINALAAFHNKGFIHSDLKPEHILYNPDEKKAVLIDFGFAQVSSLSQEMKFAGTLGYVAPEVIKGLGINQCSDLYSLGVIIYEIVAGKKPGEVYEPITSVSEETNIVLSRMLAHEPAVRPTILELYQTFSKYLPKAKIAIPTYEVKLPEPGYIEIPEISEKLQSAIGKTIIINGEIGSGKTRIVKELKYKYLMSGHHVLFYVSGEKTSFNDCLSSFIKRREIDYSKIEDKFQIFEETTQGLLEFAKDKHVVIMVDDLENLTDYELKLFRYIGYGVYRTNILIIGTSRPSERVTNLGFETLTIRPFTSEETEKLIAKTFFALETTEDKRTAAHIADFGQWLHKESGGNPLFIVEIIKNLYEKAVISYQTDRWQIKVEMLKEITIPKKIDDLIEGRINSLDDDELKILKILSIVDQHLEPLIISLILESDASIRIEHLKQVGLLREEFLNRRRVMTIPNRIIGKIIEQSIDGEERQMLSESLIKAIETVVPEDKDYLPVLARLSDEIGEREKAYNYYQSAAKNVESIYDLDAAIKYYEKLTEYSRNTHPDRYVEYLAKIGDLNHDLGNTQIAVTAYNQALELDNKDVLPKIFEGLALVYSTMGDYEGVVGYCQKALELMDQKSSAHIKTANLLGFAFSSLSKFEEAEAIFERSMHLSKEIHDVNMEADTLYYQATLEWFRNNFEEGIEIAEHALRIYEDHNLSKQYPHCLNLLGSFCLQKNDIEKAGKYLDLAIEGFKKIKHVNALCTAIVNKASLSLRGGGYSIAKDLYDEVLFRSQQTENRTTRYIVLANLASIYEEKGRFEESAALYREALEINASHVNSNCGLAMIFYKNGDLSSAKSLIMQNLLKSEDVSYYVSLSLVEIALGNIDCGRDLLNKGLDLLEHQNFDISTKSDSFLKLSQYYYERNDFERSSDFAQKLKELTYKDSRVHNIASAFMKVNDFNFKNTDKIDIEKETNRLKEIGCIYDYAYLKKLEIESLMNLGLKSDEIKTVAEELDAVEEIFKSIGANLELGRVKKLQERLYPMIVGEFSRRAVSDQYLNTFSKLAELISSNLGDENFVQNILDLIIKATKAERGALFIKTPDGMEFIAGRDMDQETIKDAGELSHTAIKTLEKDNIIFAQDALSDPKYNLHKSVMLHQIHSLLCIPLAIANNVIGAIYLDSRLASGIFGPQDKDFLLTVSKILASVIEKSITFKTMTDELMLLRTDIIEEIGSSGYLMGKSQVMKRIYKLIDSVAQTNSPVLILGETGTGKGMIARLIHLKSKRQGKRFQSINCGTIPETLLESELFGHKRGAFTGAVADKKGLLEEGEGGTVFLDEISNTTLGFQGKLLEAIEDKIIRRVGETTTRKIDVRFLFATNKDLEIEVEESRFRKDLLYRINVFSMEVPPLRERANDIPLLAQFFLERYIKETGKKLEGFAPEAMQALKEYIWTGNVRELQNVVERAAVLAKTHLITLDDIGFEKVKKEDIMPLKEIRKEAIVEALNATGWNVTKTAKLLGIGRRSLYRYIKEFNITSNSTRTI